MGHCEKVFRGKKSTRKFSTSAGGFHFFLKYWRFQKAEIFLYKAMFRKIAHSITPPLNNSSEKMRPAPLLVLLRINVGVHLVVDVDLVERLGPRLLRHLQRHEDLPQAVEAQPHGGPVTAAEAANHLVPVREDLSGEGGGH